MSERINKHSAPVTRPVAGSPRKRGVCGAFSWGGTKEVS
jgi:hypothetical protein